MIKKTNYFGQFIKMRREELGFKIPDYADYTTSRLIPRFIDGIEKGERHSDKKILPELAMVLRIDIKILYKLMKMDFVDYEDSVGDIIRFLDIEGGYDIIDQTVYFSPVDVSLPLIHIADCNNQNAAFKVCVDIQDKRVEILMEKQKKQ